MHAEVYAFVGKTTGPLNTADVRVLEIGSFNVNGSVRPFFAAAKEYVGIDRRSGPDVDVVSEASDYNTDGKKQFDIVITSEALEHSAEPADIIACAERSLVAGGLLIITAAGPDREPHNDDGVAGRASTYSVIDKKRLTSLLDGWDEVSVAYGASHGHKQGDIYATARKAKTERKAAAKAKADDAKDSV